MPSFTAAYPTPASAWTGGERGKSAAAAAATPKTPGSMDEWRMMQLQLQQQDELNFSLVLPSVNALASLTTTAAYNTNSYNPHRPHGSTTLVSPFAMTPVSAIGSVAAPSTIGSSTCTCNGRGTYMSAQCNANHAMIGDQIPGRPSIRRPQSPGRTLTMATETAAVTPSSTALPHPGSREVYQQPMHVNHSFLNQDSAPAGTLPSSNKDNHSTSLEHPLYPLDGGQQINETSHSETLSGHHSLSGLPPAAELCGSTATLLSEYAPSSADLSEYDNLSQSQSFYLNNYSHSYGPSSAGSEGPMLAGAGGQQSGGGASSLYPNDAHPFLRTSISASAVGGMSYQQLHPSHHQQQQQQNARQQQCGSNNNVNSGSSKGRHCKNCPRQQHSRRPSLGSASLLATPTATSPAAATTLGVLGGVEMELSNSANSLNNNSINSANNSQNNTRSSSPSPGPFRALSSKFAATTIKKLSASQRSLFSSSREDLTCCQGNDHNIAVNNASQENIATATGGEGCCCCCVNSQGRCPGESLFGGNGAGGSVGSLEGTSVNGGSSKAQRLQSNLHGKLSSLSRRGGGNPNGNNSDSGVCGGSSSSSKKDKARKRNTKDDTMDYNYSSRFVRQEFALYNYERQIQDFQRAARVFKEQKALTTAAAAAAIAAEARAAIAEAAAAAAESAARHKQRREQQQREQQQQHQQQSSLTPGGGNGAEDKSYSSSATSLAITPIQETDEEANNSPIDATTQKNNDATGGSSDKQSPQQQQQSHQHYPATTVMSRSGSGLLKSVSRPHRRVGSSTGSTISAKTTAMSRRRYTSHGAEGSSRGSSIHKGGTSVKTDSSYLELGQVGMPMGMDLKIPGLGLGLGFALENMSFDSLSDLQQQQQPRVASRSNVSEVQRFQSQDITEDDDWVVCEDIPLHDIPPTRTNSNMKSNLSSAPLIMPNRSEDAAFSLMAGRVSDVSQSLRSAPVGGVTAVAGHGSHSNRARGRSVHSVNSMDTVSQQISARHHQHGRLANLSNVASIYSNCGEASVGVSSCPGNNGGNSSGAGGGTGTTARGIVMENSPIQVVRATVGTIDDTTLPCFTFRMWVLSTIFVVMGSAISEYNFFRTNSAYFSIYFVQLASYFCGKAMARWLPTRVFEIRIPGAAWIEQLLCCCCFGGRGEEVEVGIQSDDSAASSGSGNSQQQQQRRTGANPTAGPIRATDRSQLSKSNIASAKNGLDDPIGATSLVPCARRRYSWSFTLNPGKFNMKEHMLIGVAAAAGCSPAYATNVLAIQSLVFNSPLGSLTGIGLVISSQCIGFSMAWFLIDYVIKPSVMIWPATLVNVSLYNTLHEHKVLTRWFTRMQLFWYAFLAVFLYQWLPRMFMPVLSSMALLCWIKPSSNVLRKLGSGFTGLGIGCISLDWSIISGVGPLFTPWWAQCNFFVGLILMLWIVTPIVYFTNYWSAMSYPIVSSNLFDNNSQLYDISKIVNNDLTFNVTMYEEYSPIIMTPYFAITYGTSFMAVMATFVHVALYYGPDICTIAKTRTQRRMVRVQKSDLVQGLRSKFFSNSVEMEEGDHYTYSNQSYTGMMMSTRGRDHSIELTSAALGSVHEALEAPPKISDSGTSYHHYNTRNSKSIGGSVRTSSRKNSESISFRNMNSDTIPLDSLGGGGAGGLGSSGIAGLGVSEDLNNFQQSSHYRQLSSQPQDMLTSISLTLNALGTSSCVMSAEQQQNQEHDREKEERADRWTQVPTEMFGTEDIHTRLMKAYPEIPGRWFGALFVVCFTMAVVVCNTSDIHLPVYALIIALLLSAVFAIPMAIIQALSSSQIGLNVLSEVVCGYLLPGNQLANSVFKCYSYMTLYQCMNLTSGFKLGHYMKVPPRKIFITVLYGTIVGAFVNIQVLDWVLIYNRQALFDADPRSGWSFRNLDLFFSASLLWGAISPERLFAASSIYQFLPLCFILGLLLPVPFYLLSRYYPPFGSYCKGRGPNSSSLLFFLPKCTCPSATVRDETTGNSTLETGEIFVGGGTGAAVEPAQSSVTAAATSATETVQSSGEGQGGRKRTCWPFSRRAVKKARAAKEFQDKSDPVASSSLTHGTGTATLVKEPISTTTPPPHLYQGRASSSRLQHHHQDLHDLLDDPEESYPSLSLEYYLRRIPWHLVNMPLVCAGASFVPQAPASFVVSAGLVAFTFAFLVLRFRHEWWRRYTFVLAAALDAGTQICNMAIFVVFALILKGAVEFPNWAGNDGTNPERCGVGDGYN
ncbi:hypothetical protein BGZ83_012015 [Gryganskiella cystojenkinii]|nr:hypothetical protein BGZ83_012015 [Gryganskiella cystojenkinii]